MLLRYNFPAHIENLSNAAAAGRIGFWNASSYLQITAVGRLFTDQPLLTSLVRFLHRSYHLEVTKSVSPVLGILEARVARMVAIQIVHGSFHLKSIDVNKQSCRHQTI